jgi:hypothetical protein
VELRIGKYRKNIFEEDARGGKVRKLTESFAKLYLETGCTNGWLVKNEMHSNTGS